MPGKPRLVERWTAYRPSKTIYFWSCVACVAATTIVGFSWGGWETAGTAAEQTRQAVTDARAQLTADFCVSRFENAADAATALASLKKAETWQQAEFIKDGGWVTLPEGKQPVIGAADICVRRLLAGGPLMIKATKSSKAAG